MIIRNSAFVLSKKAVARNKFSSNVWNPNSCNAAVVFFRTKFYWSNSICMLENVIYSSTSSSFARCLFSAVFALNLLWACFCWWENSKLFLTISFYFFILSNSSIKLLFANHNSCGKESMWEISSEISTFKNSNSLGNLEFSFFKSSMQVFIFQHSSIDKSSWNIFRFLFSILLTTFCRQSLSASSFSREEVSFRIKLMGKLSKLKNIFPFWATW